MSRTRAIRRLVALLTVCLAASLPAGAEVFEIDQPDGGDCQALGGIWVTSTLTCVLFSFEIAPEDTLRVVSVTVRFQGAVNNMGTIQNLGTAEILGTLTNTGTIENTVEWDVQLRFVNAPGGVTINESTGQFLVRPAGYAESGGTFVNDGIVVLQVLANFERPRLVNRGTWINQALLLGGATPTNPGGLLLNEGLIDNDGGVVRNTTVENHGTIAGGIVEDTGAPKATLVNTRTGIMNRVATSGMGIDNLGEMSDHTFGSGTIVNHFGGVMRVAGGQTFKLNNFGVFEIVTALEMLNTFDNEAGGILLNRGQLTNRATLTNDGLIENRGIWINDGDAADEGILDNFGTLLNASNLATCTSAPDPERIENFGVLSNSGTISSCGATNSGTWYECGNGATPAGDPVIVGFDQDADGICDAADCSVADATSWTAPAVVGSIALERPAAAGPTEIAWTEPAYLGGTAVTYDLVGSLAPHDFDGAGSCLQQDVTGLTTVDATPVLPGETLFILVRATGCADGPGGEDSAGTLRVLTTCP